MATQPVKDKPYLLSFRGFIAALKLGDIHKIGIRDLLWLTVVVALWFGWGVDRDLKHQNAEMKFREQIKDLRAPMERLEQRNALLENALTKRVQSLNAVPNQDSN